MSAYEVSTLIITGAGALATFLAVLVALWQTKYAVRKKLKCEFLYAYVPFNQATIEIKQYVSVSISNIGNKRVIINNWGIKIKDGFIQILTSGSEHDTFDEIVSVKTPYTLEPEEEVSFFMMKNCLKK